MTVHSLAMAATQHLPGMGLGEMVGHGLQMARPLGEGLYSGAHTVLHWTPVGEVADNFVSGVAKGANISHQSAEQITGIGVTAGFGAMDLIPRMMIQKGQLALANGWSNHYIAIQDLIRNTSQAYENFMSRLFIRPQK